MKLITAVNSHDKIFEVDTEGQAIPEVPFEVSIEGEPVVVTEIIGRQGNIVAMRVERGAHINHAINKRFL